MTIGRRITAARTPMFSAMRRALQNAIRESLPAPEFTLSRREFIKRSAASAAWLSIGTPVLGSCTRGGPRIAVVGAGIAGLHAAYVLKKAGIDATVYDASNRVGGRVLTARDAVGVGCDAELGGEFIHSDHADMLALIKEFGLEIVDRKFPGAENFHTAYFFGGRHYTETQVVEAFKPLAQSFAADADAVRRTLNFEQVSGAAKRLDMLSLAAYLDSLEVRGWLRDLVDVVCVSEFGLDTQRQSALNLLTMLNPGIATRPVAMRGNNDKRYVIKGGNEQLSQHLAQRVEGQLQLEHALEMIKVRGTGYSLLFRDGNGTAKEKYADIVILALPFSVLREVMLDVPLSYVKRKAIEELGYGSNAKLLVGFDQRVWRATGYSGEMFTDEPVQLSWEHSSLQTSKSAGMTFFLGGRAGMEVGHDKPEQQVNRLMVGLERAFPGAREARGQKSVRFHWPSHPHSKGSYACYTVGQWTSIAGAEVQPADKIFFAGEHCSRDYRGYMNGAAETGRGAAQAVIALLK